jgi:ribose 5-phosphate isomerase B
MKISLGCDHAAYEYKEKIAEFLREKGYEVVDFGTNSTDSCDYPEYAKAAAEAVASGECDYGIIMCGTGIGMSITANKIKGIRSANCVNEDMARLSREHNNANVLNFGARLVSLETAKKITETFLTTDFAGGRHEKRVNMIHEITGC